MEEYLIEVGFNFVASNDRSVLVQDPRCQNYRVYNAIENFNLYANAWIEAPYRVFKSVTEATTFAGL